MGLFQHLSDQIRQRPAIKQAVILSRRLLRNKQLDSADLDGLITIGDDGIDAFRHCLSSASFERKLQVLEMLGRVQKDDQRILTVIALLNCFIDDENTVLVSKAFSFMAGLEAIELLFTAMQRKDARTRSFVVQALGRCTDVKAIPALIKALNDDDVRVRCDVISSLANFCDDRVVSVLMVSLADPNWLVRDRASTALAACSDVDILSRLSSLMMDSSQHYVRLQVLQTIHRMEVDGEHARVINSERLKILVTALDDDHIEVQQAAVDALAKQPHRHAIVPLLLHYRLADQALRQRIFKACKQMSMQRVFIQLTNSDHNVRIAVTEMLGQYGEAECLPLFSDAWQYELNTDVQMWMVIAIGKLAIRLGYGVADTSIKVLIEAAEGSSEVVAFHAKKALESLSHPLAEQFVRAPLLQTKFSIRCPNCLENLELESPLTGKAWCCEYCYLGFTIRLGNDGAMIIAATVCKQKVMLPSSQKSSWFEVLSVNAEADIGTIKAAFRRLLKQYHPDKVAMLGDEFKLLAEEKTRLLTWALRMGLEKNADR